MRRGLRFPPQPAGSAPGVLGGGQRPWGSRRLPQPPLVPGLPGDSYPAGHGSGAQPRADGLAQTKGGGLQVLVPSVGSSGEDPRPGASLRHREPLPPLPHLQNEGTGSWPRSARVRWHQMLCLLRTGDVSLTLSLRAPVCAAWDRGPPEPGTPRTEGRAGGPGTTGARVRQDGALGLEAPHPPPCGSGFSRRLEWLP